MVASNREGMNVKIDYVDLPRGVDGLPLSSLRCVISGIQKQLEPGNVDSFILNLCLLMAATSGSTLSTTGML